MIAVPVDARTGLVEALQLDLIGPGNKQGRVAFDIAAIQR